MRQKSLTDFMNEVIKDLCEQGRFATAHVYKYALRSFTEFVGGGSIYFGAFSTRSLRRFQTYMEERQLSYNTISTYLRSLRAVYNSAVDADLVRGEFRLFVSWRLRRCRCRSCSSSLCLPERSRLPLSACPVRPVRMIFWHACRRPATASR